MTSRGVGFSVLAREAAYFSSYAAFSASIFSSLFFVILRVEVA
jgi:hypothetical protein